MNNKTRAEEHLLPQFKEEDKGERRCGDPDFDLIFPYLITVEPSSDTTELLKKSINHETSLTYDILQESQQMFGFNKI